MTDFEYGTAEVNNNGCIEGGYVAMTEEAVITLKVSRRGGRASKVAEFKSKWSSQLPHY